MVPALALNHHSAVLVEAECLSLNLAAVNVKNVQTQAAICSCLTTLTIKTQNNFDVRVSEAPSLNERILISKVSSLHFETSS